MASDWKALPAREDSHWLTVYQSIVATQVELDDADREASGRKSKPLGGVMLVLSKNRVNAEKLRDAA